MKIKALPFISSRLMISGILLLVIIIIAVISGCGGTHMEKAEKYLKQKKFEKAYYECKKVRTARPNYIEARALEERILSAVYDTFFKLPLNIKGMGKEIFQNDGKILGVYPVLGGERILVHEFVEGENRLTTVNKDGSNKLIQVKESDFNYDRNKKELFPGAKDKRFFLENFIVSPDGRFIVSAGGPIIFKNGKAGEGVCNIFITDIEAHQTRMIIGDNVSTIDGWAADGKTIMGHRGKVTYNPKTNKMVVLPEEFINIDIYKRKWVEIDEYFWRQCKMVYNDERTRALTLKKVERKDKKFAYNIYLEEVKTGRSSKLMVSDVARTYENWQWEPERGWIDDTRVLLGNFKALPGGPEDKPDYYGEYSLNLFDISVKKAHRVFSRTGKPDRYEFLPLPAGGFLVSDPNPKGGYTLYLVYAYNLEKHSIANFVTRPVMALGNDLTIYLVVDIAECLPVVNEVKEDGTRNLVILDVSRVFEIDLLKLADANIDLVRESESTTPVDRLVPDETK
ncbi:MAG: hypothetical protein J7M18_07230 [Candidatus Eremiobacteraeota bacterium]|nr:hypothetical protein [Candidatus Eremiobacteraeota bacterium]